LGNSAITKKTILLHAEQGLGDTIMACRYVFMVAALGAKVILEVPASLKRLLRGLEEVSTLIAKGEHIARFDVHCPLMSLPLAFKTRVDADHLAASLTNLPDGINDTELSSILNKVPYLKAEPELEARWKDRLGVYGFKVGIAWQGNPNAKIDQGRSIPLEQFVQLSQIPGLRLISLQKKHGLDQLERLPREVKIEVLSGDFDNGLDAFIDTAAVMSNLDLVITSDTSIAHLAGSLARPTWVVLKHVPDWRWLLDRGD